ncbi:glycine--tRNA ligase subunit beta [Caldisalinibacter kiritimatiensis]|uniref:Glycine--tRNA ligase beta subunit n=1 Tax=Caldisalinibacter kiritimatiensis TaxID=1304284 RepID=R1CC54_9FIRM|nr:glycine--tRNA ligase subunit beta [Caldisalinibacter kiritimatiensis]EOC99884.1 Glycyl-tRNA synthetase beta chain [Caldisalinibacter kiritimatiensis]
MNNKFLLEIGTEEIPARFIDNTLSQIRNKFKNVFKEERIKFEDIKVYATPRRLVLLAEGISEKQEDLQELAKGPSKRIAFDEDGNPTKALLGFARGQGVDPSEVVIKEYKGEEYVYAHKLEKGRLVKEVLEDTIPEIIKSINFPKSMRWGGKNFRFARPIRWIVSLFNDQVLSFDLEGIKCSNITKGHRFLGSSSIEINEVNEYFNKLRENYVIVDQEERRKIISNGCLKLAKEKGGNLLLDEDLLKELTYIVEYPTPFVGRVKEEYLKLPKEVVITPMKEHQRYIPISDDNGKLMPYFIAVRNGNEEYIDIVSKGNEKVLGARLEDAKFFFEEDTKNKLEDYVEDLKEIVYQEKLGTIYDKTIRIEKLAKQIGEYLEVGKETLMNLERASYLAKADLVTKMVYEFTELQGIMGREYANISGENDIVSTAIYEQYLPRFAGDTLPTTTAGAILSISDKLDNIAGSFAIGIQPTGSQDPYGLRRQCLGIINIILDKNLHLSIKQLVKDALDLYASEAGLDFSQDEVVEQILEFFRGRLKNMLIDNGIRYDVVDAILNIDNDDITDLVIRAKEVNKWIDKEGLNEVLAAFNRVVNLSEKAQDNKVDKELFEVEVEKELYEAYITVEDEVQKLLNKKEYGEALNQFIKLREPIDKYLDNVMVMVDDMNIRNNRLSLMKKIADTMLTICDLSKIVSK